MMLFGFKIDFWTLWGLVAQGLFFLSFIVQWYKSEKVQESHLPVEFWYLRLLASVMLFSYVLVRRDLVFFVATILQSLIYMRNISLMRKNEK
ncbi:lipid-A-disaccharide synthase N-terminal domain-containing protein [Candidatus Woesebacteria bacterium]|nr:lipid-A-disaccharide synthase N-terminal domain-containing protein [Candidatus Woesebacteria bacterium]